jgi:hypothetical protein
VKHGVLLFLALFAAGSFILAAQNEQRGPDGSTSTFVHGIEVLPAQGRPFSAASHIIWTRTLEDGTVLQRHLDSEIARDSNGRIYRESHTFVGAGDTSKLSRFYILDPIRHTRTACDPGPRHCTVTPYFARAEFSVTPAGPIDNGKGYLTRESLGTSTRDGLDVTGTRETTTIDAGIVGNDRALRSTREFWYSADLQVNLEVTRKDPREGTQVIQIDNLSRSEPDPSRFQVPAGFTVEDTRPGPQRDQ